MKTLIATIVGLATAAGAATMPAREPDVPRLCAIAPASAAAAADPHIRGMDANARALVARAQATSPTVARLVACLDDSDVVVMVAVTFLNDGLAADTRFLSATASRRFLSVRIDPQRPPPEQIGWLGHELQHSMEIAEHGEVRTEAALAVLMGRIGRSRDRGRLFETVAAAETGHRVQREAAASRPAVGCCA